MGEAKKGYGALLQDLILVASTLLAFIAVWHLVAAYSNKPYIPPPVAVAERLYESLSDRVLLDNTMVTLRRVLTSLLIALALGFTTGLVASRTYVGWRTLRPLILASYPIPHVTLIPILLWILGVEFSKIAVIAMITYYPIAISVMEWASRTPREYEDLVRSMGGSRLHVLVYVTIPYMIPGLLTGLRIAVSTAYAVVFIAESFVLTGGLGALIEESWHRLDYPAVYAYVITLSTLGITSYTIIWAIEKWYTSKFT